MMNVLTFLSDEGTQVSVQVGAKSMGKNRNILIARTWNLLSDQKSGHKPGRSLQWGDQNDKLLPLLKIIPGSDNVSTKDIAEYIAND